MKIYSLGFLLILLITTFSCASESPTVIENSQNNQQLQVSSSDALPTGGVFNRLWSDPPTLDPHLAGDTTSSGIIVEIFSGLVAFDPDLNLIPDLAESWEISNDGTVYTFKIRDNAVFHDGKKVTAQDFKWSFQRAANPVTASAVADTYLGDIIGVNEVINGEVSDIKGIKVIDDLTLQISIDSPKAYFLAKLTYPTAYVLDKFNVESGGKTWTDSPNGTGPFILDEYKIGERIILKRHLKYHLEPAKLEKVQYNLAGGSSMAMYENNEIHITGISMLDLERIKDPNDPLNADLVVGNPDFSISYIGFNSLVAPFDDIKFRQSLTYAIDKEMIAREIYSNLVVPAYGVLPPGFPGYNPNLIGLKYDIEKAKLLLSQSIYADESTRPRITVTMPGSGGAIDTDLEVIMNIWKENLGVEVEIQQLEWATFLSDLDQKKFQMFAGIGWQADYPDPQDFLDILFHSDSENNQLGYSNDELDEILEKARIETDISTRIDLYHQAENIIVNEAAWIPMWYPGERHLLIKSEVKNYFLTPMTVPKMRYVYFDK